MTDLVMQIERDLMDQATDGLELYEPADDVEEEVMLMPEHGWHYAGVDL